MTTPNPSEEITKLEEELKTFLTNQTYLKTIIA